MSLSQVRETCVACRGSTPDVSRSLVFLNFFSPSLIFFVCGRHLSEAQMQFYGHIKYVKWDNVSTLHSQRWSGIYKGQTINYKGECVGSAFTFALDVCS